MAASFSPSGVDVDRAHTILDAGGFGVLILVLALFVGPMAGWVILGPPLATGGAVSFEIHMLLWSTWLALLFPLPQIALQIRRHGGSVVRGNRDGLATDDGVIVRIARAHRNLIESLVPFAFAILVAHMTATSNRWTIAASAMYFGARIVHAATYTLGITIIRSAAFYAALIATGVGLVQLAL